MSKLRVVIIIFICIMILFFVIDGTFLRKTYNSSFENGNVSYEGDVEKIISYAIGAPSSHNMQPWLLKVTGKEVELFADISKDLPVVDSNKNQMLISQGTFIERFSQGAKKYGYNVFVGYTDLEMNSDQPKIATMVLSENGLISDVDAVSSSTLVISNSENTDLTLEEVTNRILSQYEDFSYQLIEDGDEFENMKDLLMKGTVIESGNIDAMNELVEIFRWTEWEKNKYRNGLSLASMPGYLKPFIQPIMKITSGNIEKFAEAGITTFEKRLENDIGYILIKHKNPESIDFVKAGQIYQDLIMNAPSYSIKPAYQVLEELEGMEEASEDFKSMYSLDGEVVIILTVQNISKASYASNPRHLVEDILIR